MADRSSRSTGGDSALHRWADDRAGPSQTAALALHELGHALGLGHSPVAADALHPRTSATELTARDRRTAALLYSVPPGSFK